MRALKPLVRLLQRSLRVTLLRRMIAWMSCAVILTVLGGALAQPFGNARIIRLSLIMAVLSALPIFLLWPLSEKFLTDRFRRLDEETVFEAYLEAEPGQVRDLLRQLAAERASALAFIQPPPEPMMAGLGWLMASALICVALVETGSFLILGRPLVPGLEPAPASEGGTRIEEDGFSEFAMEDPVARQMRRDRVLNRENRESNRGENPSLGNAQEPSERISSSRQGLNADKAPSTSGNPLAKELIAKRKQGDVEGDGIRGGQGPAPVGAPGEGSRKNSGPGGNQKPGGMAQGESADTDRGGSSPAPGRTGQGYEHTPDTKVSSPLLDYRSRLDARFAERTGRHISASGPMGFGDLRDFQHRYFESFTLKADVGATDEPYVALLKRRWNEMKGGTW